GMRPLYGPLHRIFAIYFISCLTCTVWMLTLKYRNSFGLVRLQIRYLIFAFAIPSALASTTNVIAPAFLGTSSQARYGPFFSLLLLGLIGHAIIRHRLMDMRIVIRRSVVYLAAFSVAGVILITLLVSSNIILADRRPTPLREVVLALA